MEQILTREEAVHSNQKFYFTGKPCKHNHLSKRYVIGKRCYECFRIYQLESLARIKVITAIYRENNKEKRRLSKKQHRLSHIEIYKAKDKAAYLKNKEVIKERQRRYRQNNPHILRAINAKRRAAKKQALMKWSNLEEIKQVYLACPKDMVVDHIIPLQGVNICGLHVTNNLQYLSKEENSQKRNKYEVRN